MQESDGMHCTAHRHQRGHISDSMFHGHMYATETSRELFCDLCRMQRWLDVETALALSQAEVGLIPADVAGCISAAAKIERLDLEWIAAETRRTSHSLVPVLRALAKVCDGGAGEFVHYGATTQDIQDTAQVLEMRVVLDELTRSLDQVLERLVPLARDHCETMMVGRTHGQPALPITFGFKVAGWIDELLRALERLDQFRPRLVVQLGGGVGTMAAFGVHGENLLERFALRLGLGAPLMSWHAARDRIAEYVTVLAIVAGSMGRIADEVRRLALPELGELRLAWRHGTVGSSTMPHKRNPEECEQVVCLSRLVAAQVAPSLQGMLVEHERDSRTLRLEWVTVADSSHYTLAAAAYLAEIVMNLRVCPEAMSVHLADEVDGLSTEALMLAVSEHLGKQSAFDLVYEISQAAIEREEPLRHYLSRTGAVADYLSGTDLERIFDARSYVGGSAGVIDGVLHAADLRISK
jgi:adenylosuccinate lyase